eukprot:15339160-Ditylum_brightwellii.AAC.1
MKVSECALPWLIKALNDINVASEGTTEYFSVMRKLVEGMFSLLAIPFLSLGGGMEEEDMVLIDLMGA